ncbi:hypothetical protein QBC37DRAFT_88019 [Rhypophila decipiens]|uniref:Secreted protein n=1 Tax=Rhypophila decipiens TaxID=261697 RepID=A0AAN7BA99_9PEZI|nr:hypothetical protein QBC37DRAFT_88019 [Rhypophila decipiens]
MNVRMAFLIPRFIFWIKVVRNWAGLCRPRWIAWTFCLASSLGRSSSLRLYDLVFFVFSHKAGTGTGSGSTASLFGSIITCISHLGVCLPILLYTIP